MHRKQLDTEQIARVIARRVILHKGRVSPPLERLVCDQLRDLSGSTTWENTLLIEEIAQRVSLVLLQLDRMNHTQDRATILLPERATELIAKE